MKKKIDGFHRNLTVSVAIATYNGENYLSQQLDSIIIQLSEKDEIVISDDGSNDNTVKIIKNYQNKHNNIRLIQGPKKGVIRNFENAIVNCKNDIIFLADQDDIWKETKVQEVIHIFANNSKIGLVLHNMSFFDENKIICKRYIKYKAGFIRSIIKSSYWGCCMAFRREFCSDIIPIPKTVPAHDQWIGMMGERKKCSYFLDKSLIKHRIHSSNVSHKTSLKEKIQFRVKLVYSYLEKRMEKK